MALRSMNLVSHKSINQLKPVYGSSLHATRATAISTVRENGTKLEDVQRTVGHAALSKMQRYERRH
jgi:hypothetical protein